ncbi:MAG: hypothetical protein ACXAEN_23125, partial [Candidatus Thorarchaeota archaeon]
MSEEDKIVNPVSVRHPARYRGVAHSSDANDFQEQAVNDIHDIGKAVNSLSSRLTRLATTAHNDNAYLRRLIDRLQNQQDYQEKTNGSNGFGVDRFVDFSDTRGILFPGGLNDEFSAMVSAQFGEVTLPANAIENRFYTTSISSGRIITAPDLVVSVIPNFDKLDGAGLVDYERGGRVSVGKPEWAFNGNNQELWIRRVEFPLDS